MSTHPIKDARLSCHDDPGPLKAGTAGQGRADLTNSRESASVLCHFNLVSTV